MLARAVIGTVVVGSLGIAGIALAAPAYPAASVPSACVVVHGPSGATVQVGYAPKGPAGCTTLP